MLVRERFLKISRPLFEALHQTDFYASQDARQDKIDLILAQLNRPGWKNMFT